MTSILEPERIVQTTSEPPRLIMPERARVFASRAARFDTLAAGHALGDWLRFLAGVSRAQHDALMAFPSVPLPDVHALQQARSHGMPPVSAGASWHRDSAWRHTLSTLLDAVVEQAPPAGRSALLRLRDMPADQIEAIAAQVLGLELRGDAVALPLVGAALQVYWTHMAVELGADSLPMLDVPGVCPCCGSLPSISVVRTGGDTAGLRYLHCALCNTEWNLVRLKCSVCESTEGITYQQIENGNEVVRAECCDGCKSYLKIIYQEKDRLADPVADDLATLTLDLLVDEAGYSRAGPNLLLVTG